MGQFSMILSRDPGSALSANQHPRSFGRALIISLISLHAKRPDARGLDVVNLLVAMLNGEVSPQIVELRPTEDPRHALHSIGRCLAGNGRVLVLSGTDDAINVFKIRGVRATSADAVAASGILRDEAVILACALQPLFSIAELEIVQRKLVRLSNAAAEPSDPMRRPRTMALERSEFSRSLERGKTTELMSNLAIRLDRAKSALVAHFQLKPREKDFPPTGESTLLTTVQDLMEAVLKSANRSAAHIPVLAEKYGNATLRYKSGPYAVSGFEDIAALNMLSAAEGFSVLESLRHSSPARDIDFLRLYYNLKTLERYTQTWKMLLAAEAIVLAEFLNAGPWRQQNEFQPLLDWVDHYSPFPGRADRTPDLEVSYLAEWFTQFLEPHEMPAL